MSDELPPRIGDVLVDTADEARIDRLWQGIERGRARPRVRWVAPAAGLAAAAALALFLWRGQTSTGAVPGPLLRSDGSAIAELSAVTELSDGSRIELSDGARLELLRNDAHAVDWLLHGGRARFHVEPGGPRSWTIEAGLVTVDVVGTGFSVERDEGAVTVAVERGVVLVRGPQVPDRAVRLTATESITVRAPVEASAPAVVDEPAEPAANLVREVAPVEAVEAPSGRDGTAPAPNAEVLMARADEARAAGRSERAAVLLGRAMALRGDPAAGLAAFTLGRLELEQLDRPGRAAVAFAGALRRSLPPRLREDASARLVEAYRRSGDAAAARRAARSYLSAYPEGRHVERVRAHAGGE